MALWPDLVEPALLKGKAYFLLGKQDIAERIFEEAYRKAPFRDEVAQIMVILYSGSFGRFQRGDFASFEKALEWAERLKEGSVKETWRSACLRRLGRWQDAEAAARKAIALDGQSALAFCQLGWALMRQYRHEEALRVLRQAADLDPADPFPHHMTGFILFRQGKVAESVPEYRKAIELDPNFVGAHWMLAHRLDHFGKLEEALGEAAIALKLAPSWSDAHAAVGYALARLGRYEEAKERFEEAVKLDPDNADVYGAWGRALRSEGMVDDAMEKFRQAVSLDFKHSYPWWPVNLARLLAQKGRLEEAFLEYCRAIQTGPNYGPAHAALPALLLKLKGKPAIESALDDLVEPLERFHDLLGQGQEDPGILQTLALARMHGATKRNLELAIDCAQRAVDRGGPGNPGGLSVLAGALFLSGRGAEAVRILEAALASPEAKRFLAEQLEEYRRQILPELPSYASIDVAVASLPDEEGAGRRLLEEFRAVAGGGDALQRLAYLEARLLERAGNHLEAAQKLKELSGVEEPEPVLRLAENLRAAGDPEAAERELRLALGRGVFDSREMWDLWAVLSLLDLARSPAEILAAFPSEAPGGYASDIVWLLERLQIGDAVWIHCGGEEFRDAKGAVWGRDRFFLGGNAASHHLPSLKGEAGGLQTTERSFPENQLLPAAYRIPLPKGAYRVTLHFCEASFHAAGLRRFDVLLEGKEELKDYEPFAAGFGTLGTKSFETRVDDGALDIEFVRQIEDPTICAIEIARGD
ncbi:MAG: tetratricopeptide repeat protein [Planctomycetes bacterium]|nr:tetratricopeptide repeat protein [Planctomycetota bacterium]